MGAGGGEAMTKHTPGPWQVRNQDTRRLAIFQQRPDPTAIGGMRDDVCVADMPQWREDHWEEREANARLIAAAPRVTEALSEMLVFFADRATTQLEIDAVNEARGALAQADDSELPSIEEMSGSIHPDCEIFETRKKRGNA